MDEKFNHQAAEAILRDMASALTAPRSTQTPVPWTKAAESATSRDRGSASAPQTDARLHRTETRYRALVEQIPAVTFLASLDESVSELYVSPHIETLLGFTQEEWLNDPFLWYRQLHPADRVRWQEEFGKTCATGVNFSSDYRFLARSGRTVWVRGQATIVRDNDGAPLFLQGIAFDITEIKEADERLREINEKLERQTEELARANQVLEQSNMELKQFTYIASHDLQTPLRAVAGFAQFLQQDYRGRIDEKADGHIDQIVEGCKRMQTLMNDVLTFTRVESGGRPFQQTDLNKLCDAAVVTLGPSIQESGGKVTRDELPTVMGDPSQLTQLFRDIISNGLKYHGDRPPRVHLSAKSSGDAWTIAVQDHGIGIAEKHHERIFEIFRRLHTGDEYSGTGIGLAVCRRIVQRHGGRIWVESEVGDGSIFYFTIPSHREKTIRQA